jgi:hypothetical protein
MNLSGPGPKEIALKVTSLRPDFRLSAVRAAQGPFEARFERDQVAGDYTVHVRALTSGIPEDQRGVVGKILLVSNDPAEPQKEVSVFALGRPYRSGT